MIPILKYGNLDSKTLYASKINKKISFLIYDAIKNRSLELSPNSGLSLNLRNLLYL